MLTLKQEGKIIRLKRKLIELEKKSKQLNMSQVLNVLLPKYDQTSNQNGRVKKWHEANQFEKGIKGGVRSGKTFPIMAETIGLSFLNRPEYHLSISPSFDNACETVVEVLKNHCKRDGLAYDFVSSKNIFYIYWGVGTDDTARILIHGMDSEWLGVTAASGDLNEPFSIHRQAYFDWSDRISSPAAKVLRKLWGGTAVPETMQWGHEYFEHEQEITELLYTDTFTTYGNTYLPKTYIEAQEKKYSGKQREVRLLGKCIQLAEGDAVYYAHDDSKDKKKFDIDEPFDFAISFDFNVNPMTAIMAGVKPGKIHVCENFKIKKSSTAELCDLIINTLKEKKYLRADGYSIHGNSFIITGDASGEHKDTRSNKTDWIIIIDKFEKAGIKIQMAVPEKNPSIRDSVNEVNEALTVLKMFIDPECKDYLRTLDMTAWKEGAKGFAINEQTEWGHHSACGRYLIWNTMVIHKDGEDGSESSASVTTEYRERRY